MIIVAPTPSAWELLRPTLERGQFSCGGIDGQLAVIMLAPLQEIAHDEMQLACALHKHLERGLLVVL